MKDAGRPLAAAEMVLVRIAYAADLPTPDEVIRSLDERQRRGERGRTRKWRRRRWRQRQRERRCRGAGCGAAL